jgi:hypothetical protein
MANENQRAGLMIACAFMLSIFFFFSVFIYAGRWQGDEFHTGAKLSEQGFDWMVFRLLNWSPRPFSEALLGVYLWVVSQSGERLIVPFLAILWASMLIVPLAGCRGKPSAVLVTSALLILAIAGRFNSDVLYWVQGAVAYIPTIALSLFLTARFLSAEAGRSPAWGDATALVLLAFSSETGAFLVLPFSSLVLASTIIVERRVSFPALLGVFSSALVMYLLMNGRLQHAEEVSQSFTVAGEVWPSFVDAVSYFFHSLFFFGENVARPHQLWSGLPTKLAFLAGVIAIGSTIHLSRSNMLVVAAWAVSLLFAAFLTTFASFYKLGIPGAPRHITIQAFFIWVAIAMVGVLASQWVRERAASLRLGVPLLIIAVAVPTGLAAKGAVADLRNLTRLVSLRDEVWASGKTDGDTIVIHTCAPGQIVGYVCPYPPAGEYLLGDGKNWVADAILWYFHKSKLVMKDQDA